MSGALTCRVATRSWELDQVHRLNRDVFAVEVGQHHADGESLVDRFHDENTYVVALDGRRLVGMLAVRDRRPFSLDAKIADLDRHLPQDARVCEVRLLAIARDRRRGMVLPQLLRALWRLGRRRGYDTAVLSAYASRVSLYERLGCAAFGPRVVRDGFEFQPMMATRERFAAALTSLARASRSAAPRAFNFLPGPVTTEAATRRAFAAPAISHRAPMFVELLEHAKSMLRAATAAPRVEILLGSGTLANGVVAAQLEGLPGRGLVIANGEFGERLAAHAARHRLAHDVLRAAWGEPLVPAEIARALDAAPYSWLWCVHCETSTGVLNDLAVVRALAAARDVRVCADCISSLGTVPVDLGGLFLASGASGKGLRGFPGLALVFYDHAVAPQPARLPSYLDLGAYAEARGVPYTHSSNLVAALAAALEAQRERPRFSAVARAAAFLRPRLEELGLPVLAAPEHATPAVFTLALPPALAARDLGDSLRRQGILVSYESGYLVERNWLQICLMGETRRAGLRHLLTALACHTGPRSSPHPDDHADALPAPAEVERV